MVDSTYDEDMYMGTRAIVSICKTDKKTLCLCAFATLNL